MTKIIRKILIWLFKDRIRTFCISKILSDQEIVHSRNDIISYTKNEMAHQIGMKLLEDNFLEIEEEKFPQFAGRRFIMKFYGLKLHSK